MLFYANKCFIFDTCVFKTDPFDRIFNMGCVGNETSV